MQSIPDTRLSPAVVMFLLVFLVLGILIILSACFRPAFYLLTVVGAVLAVLLFMIPVSEFRALALVSLVPYAFYYVILVMNKVVPVKSR
ncbi:MAG TPA: hypothetical protein PK830_05680 [Candidatus Atribacteria bacterium]|nr:hypothetical protein [Candidatus Atribacteria bacterium]HPT78574.1 hypothetical protein [Candidatus Atribacteria bacterium]